MKHRFTLVLIVMTATLFLSLKHHTNGKNSNAAPTGRTGAPGESTCGGCHTGGDYSGEMTFELGEKSEMDYVPGETYTITFVGDYDAPRYGFSITVLDENDQPAGQFALLDDENTSYATGTGGRQYVGHKNAGSINTWTFEWTAPEESVGNITFYYVINATNNNNATSGDFSETGSTTITPSGASETFTLTLNSEPENAGILAGAGEYEEGDVVIVSATANDGFVFENWSDGESVVSTEAEFEYTMPGEDKLLVAYFSEHDDTWVQEINSDAIRIFPNPAIGQFHIELAGPALYILVTDIAGRIVWQSQASFDKYEISTHDWQPGVYMVKARTSTDTVTRKLLIQNR